MDTFRTILWAMAIAAATTIAHAQPTTGNTLRGGCPVDAT
jgi:hypothetical protein